MKAKMETRRGDGKHRDESERKKTKIWFQSGGLSTQKFGRCVPLVQIRIGCVCRDRQATISFFPTTTAFHALAPPTLLCWITVDLNPGLPLHASRSDFLLLLERNSFAMADRPRLLMSDMSPGRPHENHSGIIGHGQRSNLTMTPRQMTEYTLNVLKLEVRGESEF